MQDSTDRLDVLVNNAGVHLDLRSAWHEPHLVDGIEVHWRTNYLGTAQLTRLLIPLLLRHRRRSTARRGWSTSSPSCTPGAATRGCDGHLTPYDSWAAYGTSKLALVHEAHEIERRYGARGLHAYSVHPGSVHTNIADRGLETAPVLGRLRKLAAPLERRALKTPERRRPHDRVLRDLAAGRAGRLPPLLGAEHALRGRPGRGGRPDPVGEHLPLVRARGPSSRRPDPAVGVARGDPPATLVTVDAYLCPLPQHDRTDPMNKGVLAVVVIFFGFWIFTDPHGLAGFTQSTGDAVWAGASSCSTRSSSSSATSERRRVSRDRSDHRAGRRALPAARRGRGRRRRGAPALDRLRAAGRRAAASRSC